MNFDDLNVGDRVHYRPDHYLEHQYVNGIVKEIRWDNRDAVFVVFHCAGNWDQFKEYTGALTPLRDLEWGWV